MRRLILAVGIILFVSIDGYCQFDPLAPSNPNPIFNNITVNTINGSPYTPNTFDSSEFVKRSAFSQDIEATGGDMNLNVDVGSLNVSVYDNVTFEALENAMTLTAQTTLAFTSNEGTITFNSAGNLTFNFTEGGVLQFAGLTTYAGGTTPASVDGYYHTYIDGIGNVKIPYIIIP